MSQEPETARSVERELRIAAPVETVWNALTVAEELVRWFPLGARVAPGAGGAIHVIWGDGSETEERIEIWEPGRHLRTREAAGEIRVATDYYLRGEGGETVLRVVSSGFGPESRWDDLLDAFGSGWDFELRGLRHYLERHRGVTRRVARATVEARGDYAGTWARLVAPGGFFGREGLAPEGPVSGYRVRTAGGIELSGRVSLWQPGRQFAGTVSEFNDGIFRAHLFRTGDRVQVWVWLATWGVAEETVGRVTAAWRPALAAQFPA